MSALGILYLVTIALFITLFFGYALRVRGPWGSFWTFFIIIFLAILAGDLWLEPTGPYYRDIYGLPPLAAGFLIAFLLAAATPRYPKRRKNNGENLEPAGEDKAIALALGGFFWILFALLLIVIIVGMINSLS